MKIQPYCGGNYKSRLVRKRERFKFQDTLNKGMKKYKYKTAEDEEEINLEDEAFLLITAIDNLTNEIQRARTDGRR